MVFISFRCFGSGQSISFFLPETKGIALEDMDRLFSPELPAWRAHDILMKRVQHETEVFHENHKHGLFEAVDNKPVSENVEDILVNKEKIELPKSMFK